ncbi:MAG: DUF4837 family protein [Bacteroidaceae bacterium]|nr:DUF4837 family protein [Bacteroidaceae bacterium]
MALSVASCAGGEGKKDTAAQPAAKNEQAQKSVKKPTKSTSKKKLMMPNASGLPYEMLVVMGDDQWQRPLGRAVYGVLDTDVPGLPQSERSFRITRVNPSAFDSNMFRIMRNVILVDIQNIYTQPKFKFARNVYSYPQMVMTLQAPDEASLAEYVKDNAQSILDFFTKAEMNREIDNLREEHNLEASRLAKEILGVDIWVPWTVNKFKQGKDFLWASTNTGKKDMSIVLYSYPYTDKNTFTLEYFLHKRDSVMKVNIPGGREGSYMTTQRDYVYVKDATVQGKYAQVARGLWRVQGDRMGGPFVSHSRVDEVNGRVIVAEAFIYAPESLKRDLMRRMEAALYTLQLPQSDKVSNLAYNLEEIVITPKIK